jgi:hypothetical protein
MRAFSWVTPHYRASFLGERIDLNYGSTEYVLQLKAAMRPVLGPCTIAFQ